jgi:hypothetical protein
VSCQASLNTIQSTPKPTNHNNRHPSQFMTNHRSIPIRIQANQDSYRSEPKPTSTFIGVYIVPAYLHSFGLGLGLQQVCNNPKKIPETNELQHLHEIQRSNRDRKRLHTLKWTLGLFTGWLQALFQLQNS